MLPPGPDEEEPEEGVYRFTLLSPFDADELEVMFEVNPIIPLIPEYVIPFNSFLWESGSSVSLVSHNRRLNKEIFWLSLNVN